jgi:hypothetical protein
MSLQVALAQSSGGVGRRHVSRRLLAVLAALLGLAAWLVVAVVVVWYGVCGGCIVFYGMIWYVWYGMYGTVLCVCAVQHIYGYTIYIGS